MGLYRRVILWDSVLNTSVVSHYTRASQSLSYVTVLQDWSLAQGGTVESSGARPV